MTDASNPAVNRYLKDATMDDIDHALGRPVDPLRESYRNRFACGFEQAVRMHETGFWDFTCGPSSTNDLAFLFVNEAGRKALAAHLKAIGSRHRAWVVSMAEGSMTVAAKSRSAARYDAFVTITDSWSELKFGDFCRATKVTLA